MTLCSSSLPHAGISPTLTTAEQITVKHMQVQQKREHYASSQNSAVKSYYYKSAGF